MGAACTGGACVEGFQLLSLESVDADHDGKVTAAELGRVLQNLGQPSPHERARMLIAKFDTNGDGVLGPQEYAVLMSEVQSEKDSDMSRISDLAFVHRADPLRGIQTQILNAAKATCKRLPKDNPCGFSLADHGLNEIACACEPKAKMLITLARGKARALARYKGDFDKMLKVPPVPVKKVMGALAGCAKDFPVEGAILIEYTHPETKEKVRGYFSTSGRSKSAEDIQICREAAVQAGLMETETPNIFALV